MEYSSFTAEPRTISEVTFMTITNNDMEVEENCIIKDSCFSAHLFILGY
jgi:hypothetical protein